ncbi:MAG: cyclic nucleotide-binding domain-containing protein, partial [Deltaproteobacteria bacterium]|nr:cyclic nucleotide-binding domain-containing protein [Deltaproteobacteria bacterium]
DETEIKAVAQLLTRREFKADETIMEEGAGGETMYILRSGEVMVSKALTMRFGEDDYRKTEKAMSKLHAKDHAVFGEMALITEDERSASVTAATDCTLYEIVHEDFLDLARNNTELGFKVMYRLAKILSQRLKKTNEDLIRLTTALSIALS